MTRKAARKNEDINSDLGEIVLYQSEDGQAALDVHLQDETVWLSQKQVASLFETERSVVTKHINNIFRSEELDKKAVCAKFAHTAGDGKTYQTNYYNLDVIIAVGYRVNAKRGTQFRIWATTILKDHLVRGYSLNQRRLAEKGVEEVRQILSLLAGTLESHNLVSDEGLAVLEVVNRYARTWQLLLQYDENNLPVLETKHVAKSGLEIDKARQAIAAFLFSSCCFSRRMTCWIKKAPAFFYMYSEDDLIMRGRGLKHVVWIATRDNPKVASQERRRFGPIA